MSDPKSDGPCRLVQVGVQLLPGDRVGELLVEGVNRLHHVDVLRLVHEEVLVFCMMIGLCACLLILPLFFTCFPVSLYGLRFVSFQVLEWLPE